MVAWGAIIPAIISAAGGIGSAAMSGGDTKATTTSTNAPGSWNEVGSGASDLWDEFMGMLTGGPGGSVNNDPSYWTSKQQALSEDLMANNPSRFKLLGEVDNNISLSQLKYEAYKEFKETGDADALIRKFKAGTKDTYSNDPLASSVSSAFFGPVGKKGEKNQYLIPKDELDRIISGDLDIDAAIKSNYEATQHYAALKEQKFPELAGMYSGITGTGETIAKQPSLKDMMAEDAASQKDAATKYLEEMGVLTKDTTSGLEGLYGDYKTGMGTQMGRSTAASDLYGSELDKISGDMSTPAFNVKMGNKNVPIQTRRQISLGDALRAASGDKYKGTRDDIDFQKGGLDSLYETGAGNLGALFDLNSAQEGRELNTATEFTPNKSSLEYFDKLWPIIQSFQSNRFGSGSTTDTATVPTSAAERLNTGIKTGTSIYDLIRSLNRGGSKEAEKTKEDNTLDYLY